jgi:hypothetical protein
VAVGRLYAAGDFGLGKRAEEDDSRHGLFSARTR